MNTYPVCAHINVAISMNFKVCCPTDLGVPTSNPKCVFQDFWMICPLQTMKWLETKPNNSVLQAVCVFSKSLFLCQTTRDLMLQTSHLEASFFLFSEQNHVAQRGWIRPGTDAKCPTAGAEYGKPVHRLGGQRKSAGNIECVAGRHAKGAGAVWGRSGEG